MGPACPRAILTKNSICRLIACLLCRPALVVGVAAPLCEPLKAASSTFCPAYFEPNSPPQLTLYPPQVPQVSVTLPAGLPRSTSAIEFSPDGKAIYAQGALAGRENSIYRIDFQPARQTVVFGSIDLGNVSCLSVSPLSGKITIKGWFRNQRTSGLFEIDPTTATTRWLPEDSPSPCGGSGGRSSPDGRWVVIHGGKGLRLLDTKTGVTRPIKKLSADPRCDWSPDGKLVACVSNKKIVLIDVNNMFRTRNLGTYGSDVGVPVWSPDSKHLLLETSQFSCIPTLYGESLQVVDVPTGKRKLVKSSHCKIVNGSLGWLDCHAAQQQ